MPIVFIREQSALSYFNPCVGRVFKERGQRWLLPLKFPQGPLHYSYKNSQDIPRWNFAGGEREWGPAIQAKPLAREASVLL